MIHAHFDPSTISNNSGSSQSLWMETLLPTFTPLNKDIHADVCIVGAGIVGLTCAYTLLKQGKSVVIVDQGSIAGGQTARTTGHLTWVLDDRYYNLEGFFGVDGARIAAESHAAAIDYIEKIILDENIDCDFERVDGYLFVPPEDSKDILDKEYNSIKKIGKVINKVDRAPFSSTFNTGPCLQFPNQGQFHVLKYLQGLIKAILNLGGKIFSHTHVNRIEDGSVCIVTTESKSKITSNSTIVATCTPINNRFIIHTKQAPYRTYVFGASIPKGSVPKGLYWDTANPYHYIRVQKHSSDPNSDWLLIGGEDHKTGQDQEIEAKYDHLEEWAKIRIPMIGKIEYRWSGQVFEPVDSLAFIGRNPGDRNIYISTGDSGNGITHGTIAGILIPDLILGKESPWKHLYEPSRKTLSSALKFTQENLNVSLQYTDWLTPGEMKQIDELSPNEGMILRKGIKKIAVYRDTKNEVHFNSAFCPHLGGCVRWNHGEKSWDCPCHGSRFDGCGKVLNGPAINNLCSYNHE
ncbi:MAG: FAD-dependent oxidoreductase [Parachlamydiaceae bacterium]|nr:FAD-dependent oxidoreductase [Parachlamydiaceae bacterium]